MSLLLGVLSPLVEVSSSLELKGVSDPELLDSVSGF